MPRKNRTKSHSVYDYNGLPARKKRFATKRQAEAATIEQRLLKPDLQLYVYKDIDGGWYLTSKRTNPRSHVDYGAVRRLQLLC